MVWLSASMMCADYLHLFRQIRELEAGGIDRLHMDVMDGHYVPNLALSPDMIRRMRDATQLPFDVHLMVDNPAMYFDAVRDCKVDVVVVHPDTLGTGVFRAIRRIRDLGIQPGIALNPLTSVDSVALLLGEVSRVTVMTVDPGFAGQPFLWPVVSKIGQLAAIRASRGLAFTIEVDGALSGPSLRAAVEAGADVLVLGTSGLFSRSEDLSQALIEVKAEIQHMIGEGRREGGARDAGRGAPAERPGA